MIELDFTENCITESKGFSEFLFVQFVTFHIYPAEIGAEEVYPTLCGMYKVTAS